MLHRLGMVVMTRSCFTVPAGSFDSAPMYTFWTRNAPVAPAARGRGEITRGVARGTTGMGLKQLLALSSCSCLRARRTGYRLLLVPQAQMWHKVSASGGGADSPRERYLMARNSVRYFRKHVTGARWLAVIPWRLGSAIKTVVRLILRRNGEAAAAYLRGLKDGLQRPHPELQSEAVH